MGLEAKVKLWVSSDDMCSKMTAHWKEKEHWFRRTEGWPLKKEVWDGDRFADLSWFFDPESEWCLPVRCTTANCKNIISGEIVESSPEVDRARKEIVCDECYNVFDVTPTYVKGDPRNIALMGMYV
jgi:hypothetical protein